MKKSFLCGLVLVGMLLGGCGGSSEPASNARPDRLNVLQILESEDAALARGVPSATLGRVTGYNAQGRLVFGPDEEPYDDSMEFFGLPDECTQVEVEYLRGQGFTLASRTESVDFVGDDDGVIQFNNLQPRALPPTPETFTLRIENSSDYSADEVFVTILAKNKADTAFFYLSLGKDGKGTMEAFQGLDRSSDYSFALSSALKEEEDNAYSLDLPYDKLVSGRVYLSFGQKLEGIGLVNTADPLSLVTPSATGAPDAPKLYEFMELSATIQDTPGAEYVLFANTSVVDFFSVGLGMTLDYHDATNTQNLSERVGFVDNARSLVLQAFASPTVPKEFQSYVLDSGTQKVLRILSPVQTVAVNSTGDTSRFLNQAIDDGWTEYSKTVLNIPDTLRPKYGYAYTGQLVTNNVSSFTCVAAPPTDSASLNETSNLPKPTSRIVFFCDDDQPLPGGTAIKDTWKNDGTDGHKRLCSLLGAALNRGVFENYEDWDDATKYYTRADGLYNHYSKIMHQFAIDGKVYGFGYDDVYGQDPTLSEKMSLVNQVVLEIPSFPKI